MSAAEKAKDWEDPAEHLAEVVKLLVAVEGRRETIAYLRDELSLLKATADICDARRADTEAEKQNVELRARIDRLVTALRFYADRANFHTCHGNCVMGMDYGSTARNALSDIGISILPSEASDAD